MIKNAFLGVTAYVQIVQLYAEVVKLCMKKFSKPSKYEKILKEVVHSSLYIAL